MTQRTQWQSVGGDGPRLFERVMVPAIFRPWAEDLVARSAPAPGERVLDVACGTGVVAGLAAERAGPSGRAVGLDISPGMLAVARDGVHGPGVEWMEGSADALPFPDGAFDLVLCQQGLQYFPDRAAALGEMRRVLVDGGRLAASAFCASPVHLALAEALAPHVGAETAAAFRETVALADPIELRALVAGAGFSGVTIGRVARRARFASPDLFLAYNFATRLAGPMATLGEEDRAALTDAAMAALRPFMDGGALVFTMEAHVVTARS